MGSSDLDELGFVPYRHNVIGIKSHCLTYGIFGDVWVSCPRALMSVPPIDLCVTTSDHHLLNVRLPKEQLCHGAPVAAFGDPSDSNLVAHQEIAQMVRAAFAGTGSALTHVVQGCRCMPVEPFHQWWWRRCRRRSRRRSQRMQEQLGASVTLLGGTDDLVTSTRTFGSLIRGGPCGASTIYTVCRRLARCRPQYLGTGSCSPMKH